MNKIEQLIADTQEENIIKPTFAVELSKITLDEFGIDSQTEFYFFFSKYFTYGLSKRKSADSLVEMAREDEFTSLNYDLKPKWSLSDDYLIFAADGYHGGYLYNRNNETVWDFTLGEQSLLGTDKMRHWNNFYEFLTWYLVTDE